MRFTLYFHPLSSYCHKALIALYEHGIAFEPQIVNLGDAAEREAFLKISPLGRFPALRDGEADRVVLESSVIIEYLDRFRQGGQPLVPADPDRALEARRRDRFFDFHVMTPMQKVVFDRLRPEAQRDPFGVSQAREQLRAAYAVLEREIAGRTWALGDDFSLADCAAAPSLFYADKVAPLGEDFPNVVAYRARLMQRPSYARALVEAEPYLKFLPQE
ncbi:glutathione S-transferase family protein [Bosea sp. (in: a-proteobacteria)]|jgi:glutathione S-transferase|uniref:glutathione S-transferase family protein n=1 Tax=Bosea sp. (in: a-proteobacteria) TaxID=1871050 RepID=UPI003F72B0CA